MFKCPAVKVLVANRCHILDQVKEVESIMDSLFQDGIFNDLNRDSVRASKTPRDQMRSVLEILECKPRNWYEAFRTALKRAGFEHVEEKLKDDYDRFTAKQKCTRTGTRCEDTTDLPFRSTRGKKRYVFQTDVHQRRRIGLHFAQGPQDKVFISKVEEDSLAELNRIKSGSLVLKINNKHIPNWQHFVEFHKAGGQVFNITIIRDKKNRQG